MAQEWEGRTFRAPKVTTVRYSETVARTPEVGDKLFIWTHRYRKQEKVPGEGLKATCFVRKVSVEQDEYWLEVEHVELFKPAISREYFEKFVDINSVISSLISRTRTQTLYLDASETSEFQAVVSGIIDSRTANSTGILARLNSESLSKSISKEWNADRLFREHYRECRPNQSAFRTALQKQYENRCCITGFDAEEGLEAAHIFPFASGHPDRDKPENGLLLRADVHKLFDRLLIAINPEDNTIWLSNKITETEYVAYEGDIVSHFASSDCLRAHYLQAQIMNNEL